MCKSRRPRRERRQRRRVSSPSPSSSPSTAAICARCLRRRRRPAIRHLVLCGRNFSVIRRCRIRLALIEQKKKERPSQGARPPSRPLGRRRRRHRPRRYIALRKRNGRRADREERRTRPLASAAVAKFHVVALV